MHLHTNFVIYDSNFSSNNLFNSIWLFPTIIAFLKMKIDKIFDFLPMNKIDYLEKFIGFVKA